MPASRSHSRVMYIERKAGNLTGRGRIGRVTFSKTFKTLYYKGLTFQSLKGDGYKASHYELGSDETYWISGPKKNGQDTLYPGIVEIDEDVREEYWLTIRCLPDRVSDTSYRSEGKHG